MKRTVISKTLGRVGEKVRLCGWINSVRSYGKLSFADLRDRSGYIQLVGSKDLGKLHGENVVEITGTVRNRQEKNFNEKIATGKIEIEVEKIKVLSESGELPFDIYKPKLDVSLPVMLDYRNASLRNKKTADIFRVQATIVKAFREYMNKNDFIEFQAPTIVATATEGGSQVFAVDYFDQKAFMAQSPQFYKQIMVSIFERVFTLSHAYRAEPSVTTRHLTEYVGLDVEFGFIDSWLDVVEMADNLVKAIFDKIKQEHADILEEYGMTIPETCKKTPVIKLSEAQEIIFERTKRDIRGEPDMDPEGERGICKWSKEEHGSDMVFISHFPTKKRPWYTYQNPKNPKETLSFDLIGCGVEWITGGQRIHQYDVLVKNIKKMGADPKDFEIPYLQAFKYGMPPEGGFCIGLERITQNILGLDNIRQATLYPRDMERIDIRLSNLRKKKKKNLYDNLIELLKKEEVEFEEIKHEEVRTSQEAADARGTKLEQGAKALLMFADEKAILVVLSAAEKLDSTIFKKLFGIKNLRMASENEVGEISGVKIGAVPPFGNLFNVPVYVDKNFLKNEKIVFNAGLRTRSVMMKLIDFVRLVKHKKGNYAKKA